MASARHNRKRKHGRRRMGLLFKLLCGAALAAALTVGATVFFQVETIAVVGSSRYTPEEVITASGVAVGDNLFRMNKHQVSQRIRQQLPYIGDVSVQRGLPSTLTFTVKEWAAAARVEVYADPEPAATPDGEKAGDESSSQSSETPEEQGTAAAVPWLINAAGKLLEEAGEDSGAIPVVGLTVLSPRAGEQMAVPQSQQERLETLKKLLSALERAGMLEQVGSIDLTHSTWISIVYRERFEARIPLGKDLDHSLGVLALAVEDTIQTRGEQAAGIMDLTQEEYAARFSPAAD